MAGMRLTGSSLVYAWAVMFVLSIAMTTEAVDTARRPFYYSQLAAESPKKEFSLPTFSIPNFNFPTFHFPKLPKPTFTPIPKPIFFPTPPLPSIFIPELPKLPKLTLPPLPSISFPPLASRNSKNHIGLLP
ncbi:unnamed protein product [Calypogeia fissa]